SDMLAGSETVDVVIRTGAIVVERSVSPDRDLVGLPRFGVGQQEFRKNGVVAPVLQFEALPFAELDSKKPLPIVEAEAVRLVGSGQFQPGRRNYDVSRPCRSSAAHVPFRFDAHPPSPCGLPFRSPLATRLPGMDDIVSSLPQRQIDRADSRSKSSSHAATSGGIATSEPARSGCSGTVQSSFGGGSRRRARDDSVSATSSSGATNVGALTGGGDGSA